MRKRKSTYAFYIISKSIAANRYYMRMKNGDLVNFLLFCFLCFWFRLLYTRSMVKYCKLLMIRTGWTNGWIRKIDRNATSFSIELKKRINKIIGYFISIQLRRQLVIEKRRLNNATNFKILYGLPCERNNATVECIHINLIRIRFCIQQLSLSISFTHLLYFLYHIQRIAFGYYRSIERLYFCILLNIVVKMKQTSMIEATTTT